MSTAERRNEASLGYVYGDFQHLLGKGLKEGGRENLHEGELRRKDGWMEECDWAEREEEEKDEGRKDGKQDKEGRMGTVGRSKKWEDGKQGGETRRKSRWNGWMKRTNDGKQGRGGTRSKNN